MEKNAPSYKNLKFLFSETFISKVELPKNDVKNRKFLLLRGRVETVCALPRSGSGFSNYRLNMELDLQSLFGLPCTAVLIG
jgi:hypothetical protein